jgi:hypothetical protein
MMNRRKSGNTGRRQEPGNRKKEACPGGDDSDRKHLTGREVERLIEATRDSRAFILVF